MKWLCLLYSSSTNTYAYSIPPCNACTSSFTLLYALMPTPFIYDMPDILGRFFLSFTPACNSTIKCLMPALFFYKMPLELLYFSMIFPFACFIPQWYDCACSITLWCAFFISLLNACTYSIPLLNARVCSIPLQNISKHTIFLYDMPFCLLYSSMVCLYL